MEVGEGRLVGGAPLLAAIAREIGVVESVDRNVSWDSQRSKLSPGERILALVINLLTNRHPLYKVWQCSYGTDVELLLGRYHR